MAKSRRRRKGQIDKGLPAEPHQIAAPVARVEAVEEWGRRTKGPEGNAGQTYTYDARGRYARREWIPAAVRDRLTVEQYEAAKTWAGYFQRCQSGAPSPLSNLDRIDAPRSSLTGPESMSSLANAYHRGQTAIRKECGLDTLVLAEKVFVREYPIAEVIRQRGLADNGASREMVAVACVNAAEALVKGWWRSEG